MKGELLGVVVKIVSDEQERPTILGTTRGQEEVQIPSPQPFRVFITDLSDEHSIFLRFFIVFNLCIEQDKPCSFLLCREVFNGHTLPHIQLEVFFI